MSKDKSFEDWDKPHWHRLRKWSEKKNSGEFIVVFDSGLPVRIKAKIETENKDEYTEVQTRHLEIDLTKE